MMKSFTIICALLINVNVFAQDAPKIDFSRDWAATDLDKTRLLVMNGADVNARSDDARTPLTIAAGRPGNAPVVKFLLERGANPNASANPAAESSSLIEAAMAGDASERGL